MSGQKKKSEAGLAHLWLVVGLAIVLAVVGFVGVLVYKKQKSKSFDVSVLCPTPLLQMPADIKQVTSVLYPGQYRGGQYKPHGGFRFDKVPDNNIEVKAPMMAKLIDGARYIEQGETQVLLDFKSNCGVNYRFDHLLTLAPKIQAAVDTLPQPKEEDSRTHDFKQSVSVDLGEVVATAVGFPKTHNVSFDLGVYDYRQANVASKDPTFESAHANDGGIDMVNHGICWLNYLPASDTAILKTLPAGDQGSGSHSDYCK